MFTIQEPNPPQHNRSNTQLKVVWHSLINAPLFELAFRPFFLLATFFSSLALITWILMLNGHVLQVDQSLAPVLWHAHEMLFGFAVCIAIAFILTAGQTWTNQPSLSKGKLLIFVAIWCVIRIALYVNSPTSITIAIYLTIIWWFIAIVAFSRMVLKANNRRNFIFIPLLFALGGLNASILVLGYYQLSSIALALMQTSLFMMTFVITIIGGRVIPFFTVRGANTQPINTPIWLEHLTFVITLTTVVTYLLQLLLPNIQSALPWLFSITGSFHLMRIAHWKSYNTAKFPLLWSLHLSYALMAIGFILIGLSYSVPAISFSMGVHTITIGGISLMILSMASRVSLGHTSRKLVTSPLITIAFLLMFCAMLSRVVLISYLPELDIWWVWLGSVILWCSAMVLFLWIYTPILIAKRAN